MMAKYRKINRNHGCIGGTRLALVGDMAKRFLLMMLMVAIAVAIPATSEAGRVAKTAKKTTKSPRAKIKSKAASKGTTRPNSAKPTGLKLRGTKTTKKTKEAPSTKKAAATKTAKKVAKAKSAKTKTKATKAKSAKAKTSKSKQKKVSKKTKAKLKRFRKVLIGLGITAGVVGALVAMNVGDPGNPTSLVSVVTTAGVTAGGIYAFMKSIWTRGSGKAATAS